MERSQAKKNVKLLKRIYRSFMQAGETNKVGSPKAEKHHEKYLKVFRRQLTKLLRQCLDVL